MRTVPSRPAPPGGRRGTGRRRSCCPTQHELRIVAPPPRPRARGSAARGVDPAQLLAAADVVCATSGGSLAAPWLVRSALASGTVPVVLAPRDLRGARRATATAACSSPPGDVDHPRRPDRAPGREPAAAGGARRGRAARDPQLVGRRGRDGGDLPASRGAPPRPGAAIPSCAAQVSPPARDPRRPPHAHRPLARLRDAALALLETAKEAGLGAIAITDHNEVSGAFAAQRARRGDRRDQGDRRRGGEDRRAGRGDRPLPRRSGSSAG